MSKSTQGPKRDFGFYATIPRIVRTQYKDLSHAEKWLYVCLKDLCGDKGTCFRTLRSLSEETDVSTGSLSKMIPNLHKVGLIHAEKKRRSESGKEVWHITIADVWAENAKVCSKNEQSTSEIVQKMNNVVQKMNDKPKDRSENERDCSNFVDRRKNTEERTLIEERTREEKSPTVVKEPSPSPIPDVSLSHSFAPSLSSETKESSQEKAEVVFTPEEESVYDLAEKLDLVYLKRDENHKESCAKLIKKGVTTQEKMESLITHCKQVPFLAGKALNLKNLVNELAGWLQLQRRATSAPSPSPVVSTIGKNTAELLASQEATKQKILEKEATQGERRLSPSERLATLKKQRASAVSTESHEKAVVSAETTNEPARPISAVPAATQSAQRPLYGPKKDETPAYTRLPEKPTARARSLQGRMMEQQRVADGRKE